jgi:hypothetical protein
MLAINAYTANTWGAASSLSGVTATSVAAGSGEAAGTGDTSTISTLARQLSDAAERAAVRDAGKTRDQLAELENVLRNEFAGAGYFASNYKAKADAEVPDTDDPELLARAEQATKFVNSSNWSGKNPFAGLSREQLALIMYDQGDAFTINERRAAFHEYSEQRNAWARRVCAQAQIEQRQTNTFINFYKACIAEYQAASPIEQAIYPPNYVSRMEYYIGIWESGMGIDYNAGNDRTLLEMLLPEKEYDRNLSWGLHSTLAMPESDGGTK